MKLKHWILSGITGVVGAVIAGSALYTVDEIEQVVVTRFGNPIRTVKTAGLNVKVPFVDVANYFDDSTVAGVVQVGDILLALDSGGTSFYRFTTVDNTAGAPNVVISAGVAIT